LKLFDDPFFAGFVRKHQGLGLTLQDISVFAKAGRAESATDPAPLMMVDTIINLKPVDQWRTGLPRDQLVDAMDAALPCIDEVFLSAQFNTRLPKVRGQHVAIASKFMRDTR